MANAGNDLAAGRDDERFSSILVPVDGSAESERAIVYAGKFAVDRILLLRVLGGDPPGESQSPLDIFTSWRHEKIDEAVSDLERLAKEHAEAAQTIETATRYGNPAEIIIEEAVRHDLIVMSSHGRGAAGRKVFGSVADRVLSHSTVPTLVVRVEDGDAVGTGTGAGRIVVPLDGSELAEEALPVARRAARMLERPLHLTRVVGMDEILATVRTRRKAGGTDAIQVPDADPYEVARIDTEAEATSYLEDVAARFRDEGFQVTEEMRGGTPAFELAWAVTPSDLVVMTSRGQGGFQRWMVGSVAERMVREAPAPVLLVPVGRNVDGEGSGAGV